MKTNDRSTIMNTITLDLFSRFKASDTSDNTFGDTTEKQIAKMMDDNNSHGGRGNAPFEPRQVDAVLQEDKSNSRKRKNSGVKIFLQWIKLKHLIGILYWIES